MAAESLKAQRERLARDYAHPAMLNGASGIAAELRELQLAAMEALSIEEQIRCGRSREFAETLFRSHRRFVDAVLDGEQP